MGNCSRIIIVSLAFTLLGCCPDERNCDQIQCPAGFVCVEEGPFQVCRAIFDGGVLDTLVADSISTFDQSGEQARDARAEGFSLAPLTVVSSTPAEGAPRADLRAPIRVTFSAELDPSTLAPTSFSLGVGDTAVGGALSYDAPTRVVTFTPSQLLADGAEHTLTMTTALRSTRGATLAQDSVVSFTTARWEPITTGSTADLYAVEGGTTKVYIAGTDRLHSFDGTTWEAEATWPPAGSFFSLHVVAADDIWAAGSGSSAMHHYDGTVWTRDTSLSTSIPILSVAGLGSHLFTAGLDAQIFRYLDGAWVKWNDHTPGIFNMEATFNDIWAHGPAGITPSTAYAVALNNGNTSGPLFKAKILSTLTSWTLVADPGVPTASLYGIWGTAANHIVVVGDNIVSRFDGTTWTAQTIPGFSGILRDVWGTGPDDVYVVGDEGMLAHWNGTNWVKLPTHTTETLRSVWGSSTHDIWAVGRNGTVLRYQH
ncbi:MAG: Ig-like domain-containing protein [Deltaproteobacteria bacterium]|nr:Ig-like domain-containing protein [Deltaproteobacteria bacterium]